MQQLQTDLFHFTSYSWIVLMAYWFFAGMRTKITLKREPLQARVLYLLLLVGAFACVYYDFPGNYFITYRLYSLHKFILWSGALLNIAGIAYAILARYWLGNNWSGRITLKAAHQLITDGPYRFSRHPIYTGMLTGLAGAAMIQGEIRSAFTILIFLTGIWLKLKAEEKLMREKFSSYEAYASRTKRLIPFIY